MSQDAIKPKLAYPIDEAFSQIGVSRTRGYQLIGIGLLRTYKDGKRRLCSHMALVECQRAMEKASTEGKRNASLP